MFQQIIQAINDFPPLSDTAQLIHQLHRNAPEGIEPENLVNVIESDPVLSANILRLTNSPFYGLKTQVSSAMHATTLLGVNTVYAITLQFAMNQNIKPASGVLGMPSERFNNMCALQRSLLTQWYTSIDAQTAHYLAPLALMMETGKLILENELRQSEYYGEYVSAMPQSDTIEGFEQEFLGETTYALTAELFRHWNLDATYTQILIAMDSGSDDKQITRYAQLLRVIRTAVNMKAQLSPKSIDTASELVQVMGYSAEAFTKMAKKLKIINETHFSRIH